MDDLSRQVARLNDAVESAIPVKAVLSPGAAYTAAFPAYGSACYRIVLDQDLTLAISGGTQGQYQELIIVVHQPVSGNCNMVLPSNVTWLGKPPFIDSRIGAVSIFKVITFDGGQTYLGTANG